jgi:TetR/AcrR family transcriptional regulator, transcriptional repressor for nem operon
LTKARVAYKLKTDRSVSEEFQMMPLKDRIVHEALRQFSSKGFMSTSISDILESVGTSKGGLYNHFKSKEDLFFAALSEARKIWRQRNLAGLDRCERPLDKLKQLLRNYRDRYLADSENLPGGCVFVALAVELHDQQPHLAQEVNEGFDRFKGLIKRLLDQERQAGNLKNGIDTGMAAEVIFSGLLGACVSYSADKSKVHLDRTIQSLLDFLTMAAI